MSIRRRRLEKVGMTAFHIQARLVRYDQGCVVRDDVRLADADDRDETFRIAADLVAEGFTVWIWTNATREDQRLELVDTLRPPQRSVTATNGRPQGRGTSSRRGTSTNRRGST